MASIVRLDKVKAVYNGNIYSVQATEELENGNVGQLGDLMTDEREIRTLNKPATAKLTTQGAVLIAHDELIYDEQTEARGALQNFSIDANMACRAYELEAGDIFSITKDGIFALANAGVGPVVKNNYVIMANNSFKLTESSSIPSNSKFACKIIQVSEPVGVSTTTGKPGVLSNIMDFVVLEVIVNDAILGA